MTPLSVYHVVPDDRNGWKVKLEGADVGSQGYRDKLEAVARARQLARLSDAGRVVIHRADGTVEAQEECGRAA
jgi:hypothetical protein